MKVKEYNLSDLLTIKNGKDYKHLDVGDIPVYGTGGILTYVNENLFSGESILLPRKGTLDNIIYVEGNFWTVDTMYWSIVNSTIAYPKYLYLYLSLLDLSAKDSGSTLPSMTFDSYYSVPVKLPELKTQVQIADKIFSITNKININNKINTELESMAKTLYDYWFLQFEFPNDEGKPYKSSGGKMVWNEELKREIPEGWNETTLFECSDIVSGYPFKTETYSAKGKYDIYTIGNVQDGYIDNVCPNKIDFIPKDIDLRCVLQSGDIIISLTGNVGRVGIVYAKNALLNQRVLKIIPSKNYRNFLYLLFRNTSFIEVMQRIASGSSQKNLSPSQVKSFKFAIPNDGLLEIFNKKINGYFDLILSNLSENQELASLRDFLLPLLINGQVKFKD
jgi:type I restriction enzyme S subunit